MQLVAAILAAIGALPASAGNPAPEWVKRITPGTWQAVSLNTLSDLDPARDPEVNPNYPSSPPWRDNQAAILDAWNGAAYANRFGTYGSLVVSGGGHADYYGNEVYAFDLESRRWQRLTNPYPSPVFPVADGIWPDGTPSVPHTYDEVEYHPGTNSFVMLKTQSHNGGGFSTPVVALFSLDGLRPPDKNASRDYNKRNWRLSPVHTANYVSSGGWSVYDPKRDVFWANGGAGGNAFVAYDPKPVSEDGRYGAFRTFKRRSGITNAVAAYDPSNDIAVVTEFRAGPNVAAIELSKPEGGILANVTLKQGGTPPVLEQAHGWEWSPTRRAFIYYRRGGDVFEFRQRGPDWRSAEWQWSKLTSPDNGLIPAGEQKAGVFSKFRIASFDDAEVALVVADVKGPVYAFRMPFGDMAARPRPPAGLTAK